ncbi:uncharacterized protein LOC143187552 [Calliopsis andreniformis]|uniref:uncharacterized protein LOC143187552 n=1 Tax=Calliopsis andreniformis TaxID=337506 RepID=UPI003FCC60A8
MALACLYRVSELFGKIPFRASERTIFRKTGKIAIKPCCIGAPNEWDRDTTIVSGSLLPSLGNLKYWRGLTNLVSVRKGQFNTRHRHNNAYISEKKTHSIWEKDTVSSSSPHRSSGEGRKEEAITHPADHLALPPCGCVYQPPSHTPSPSRDDEERIERCNSSARQRDRIQIRERFLTRTRFRGPRSQNSKLRCVLGIDVGLGFLKNKINCAKCCLKKKEKKGLG